ncbi:MAG TPA: hypothetical protein VK188_03460 [Holophaga sp.]|nr:hypothetical protein [Holophaga sp.]
MRAMLLMPAVCAAAYGWSPVQPCTTPEYAKTLAEVDTGREAVVALPIIQTDGTKGWLVEVHMPGKEKGWRCIIDCDLAKARSRDPIPNPARRKS